MPLLETSFGVRLVLAHGVVLGLLGDRSLPFHLSLIVLPFLDIIQSHSSSGSGHKGYWYKHE